MNKPFCQNFAFDMKKTNIFDIKTLENFFEYIDTIFKGFYFFLKKTIE